ncbi:DUF4351 domain-containing protein [Thermostichus vulcanus]|uniref:DUF4351 domain-containing protein n=1 Tax=Thermostichus vulcanus TaxID=32053 RepID=UPI002445C612|nr:DUF4351 domain-containing protein [Thermostichus vulcanus]
MEAQIRGLSLEQIELLGEALLEFGSLAELKAWLTEHSRISNRLLPLQRLEKTFGILYRAKSV